MMLPLVLHFEECSSGVTFHCEFNCGELGTFCMPLGYQGSSLGFVITVLKE
jgi:hypothetical protein